MNHFHFFQPKDVKLMIIKEELIIVRDNNLFILGSQTLPKSHRQTKALVPKLLDEDKT